MSLILIVEDEIAVRQTVGDWLSSEGYQVATAGSVGEARSWFAAAPQKPDAALIDIKLPDGNGFGLADFLSEDHGFDRVIFLTAFFWEEETRRELVQRGKPYFEKPLKFHKQVLPFLRRFLDAKES
jgi:DNA-binding response OmpR family regulator